MKVLKAKGTPWLCWNKWHEVKSLLLSSNEEENVRGVEIVALWRSRGKVPHAVACTSDLVEMRLVESVSSRMKSSSGTFVGNSGRSENELRMQYSMVLVRTVNGFVDTQQQGYYADSAYNIARKIGMPAWVVELRHDATHNQLPSLAVLRSAAVDVLNWLREYYWRQQQKVLEDLQEDIIAAISGERTPPVEDEAHGMDVMRRSDSKGILSSHEGGDGGKHPKNQKGQGNDKKKKGRDKDKDISCSKRDARGNGKDVGGRGSGDGNGDEGADGSEERSGDQDESSSSMRSSLTYATTVFLPIFFEMAIVMPGAMHNGATDMNAVRDDAVANAEVNTILWQPLMDELCGYNPSFPITVLCHILNRTVTLLDSDGDSGGGGAVTFALASLAWWTASMVQKDQRMSSEIAPCSENAYVRQWARIALQTAYDAAQLSLISSAHASNSHVQDIVSSMRASCLCSDDSFNAPGQKQTSSGTSVKRARKHESSEETALSSGSSTHSSSSGTKGTCIVWEEQCCTPWTLGLAPGQFP